MRVWCLVEGLYQTNEMHGSCWCMQAMWVKIAVKRWWLA